MLHLHLGWLYFFLQMIALTIAPQFFRCTDLWGTGQFQQYSFECAEGTVFDPALGVCNWPQVIIKLVET